MDIFFANFVKNMFKCQNKKYLTLNLFGDDFVSLILSIHVTFDLTSDVCI